MAHKKNPAALAGAHRVRSHVKAGRLDGDHHAAGAPNLQVLRIDWLGRRFGLAPHWAGIVADLHFGGRRHG